MESRQLLIFSSSWVSYTIDLPLLSNRHLTINKCTGWDQPRAPVMAMCRPRDVSQLKDALYVQPTPAKGDDIPSDHTENILQWHQLAATATIVSSAFSTSPTKRPHGVLLADDVGVGKTPTSFAVIGHMIDTLDRAMLGHQNKIAPIHGMSGHTVRPGGTLNISFCCRQQ